ncbi:hypothetical protein ARC78_01890 [Stenotrophomonas pictorum JCM 9942]|uniref:Uncharacterized protein n=1 Tax=Stenotrophomonas pictorum JCM 9942 TaxID=1236960 RepID=A0A0R0A2T8_9GAMM|nr:aminoglycoside phosphotransferase family protein [Stenotrophomonas pictorum]KRG39494.1 hypothetical protein ARC78_01890 [Stenotrophomonas pictorum JCM 9942]
MGSQHLQRWQLRSVGAPIVMRVAGLLPVLTQTGTPAMLKQPLSCSITAGRGRPRLWNGDGAIRPLASDGATMLLEHIVPGKPLRDLPVEGADRDATVILCDVAAKSHSRIAVEAHRRH